MSPPPPSSPLVRSAAAQVVEKRRGGPRPPPDSPAPLPAPVRNSARESDPDRYLAALLAPAALTSDLMILAGLGAELARIPAQIREPMMGEIRLQLSLIHISEPTRPY